MPRLDVSTDDWKVDRREDPNDYWQFAFGKRFHDARNVHARCNRRICWRRRPAPVASRRRDPRLMATKPSTGFTVSARTILELGAELISSDSIALYELIKNAYDAGSKRATVQITNVFRHSSLRNQLARIVAARASQEAEPDPDPFVDATPDEGELVAKLQAEIVGLIDGSADEAVRIAFSSRVQNAQTLTELEIALLEAYRIANLIEIIDTGEGMSLKQLQDVFLTIGTRSRLEGVAQRHYVGGKGIGRL